MRAIQGVTGCSMQRYPGGVTGTEANTGFGGMGHSMQQVPWQGRWNLDGHRLGDSYHAPYWGGGKGVPAKQLEPMQA